MKHSKGPWALGNAGENLTGEIISGEVISLDGFPVAECNTTCILPNCKEILNIEHWSRLPGKYFIRRSNEETVANLKLIAAAPELLKACKAMYNYIFTDKELSKKEIKKVAENAIKEAEK